MGVPVGTASVFARQQLRFAACYARRRSAELAGDGSPFFFSDSADFHSTR